LILHFNFSVKTKTKNGGFMKICIKKSLPILIIAYSMSIFKINAFEPSIDVDLPIVSNYVFRGVDVFQSKFVQEKKSISGFNLAPAIQPSITFNFTEGWSFNIWSSFALTNRQDKDIDQILQVPGEDPEDPASVAFAYKSFISGNLLGTPVPFSIVENAVQTAISGNEEAIIKGDKFAPAFYKEPNGLRRVDEVDLTLSYSFDTKLGKMTGGIVTYLLPNTTKGVTGTDQSTELFVGYSPKALPNLSITLYGETNLDNYEGATFTYISYSIPLIESQNMTLSFDPGLGYQTQDNLQGIKYVSLPFTLAMGSLKFMFVGIYRPDTRFFDSDPYKGDAVKLLGLSTISDGLIPDPAKNTGILNSIINGYISKEIQTALTAAGYPFTYTYTPTQSIPKLIYYFSIGYSTTF
jgi:hypothetical protein